MPGEDIYSWSTTAASNDTADTLINWREGQARASVNDSMRSVMAAHAKQRNLLNGTFTAGGSANALIFTSGVGYTTVPTGFRVLLKISATNTGAATLSMDGIAGAAIVDVAGNALLGREIVAGRFVEFLYDGTNWILLHKATSTGGGLSGRFVVNSGTVVAFVPYNGSAVKIAGVIYDLPAAGVSATITNCYSDGVASQSLLVGNTYNAYIFSNSGVLTLDFSTAGHSADTTPGNIGIEIKTGDLTRSLVGKIFVGGGPSVGDSSTSRSCLSWFNRHQRVVTTNYSGTTSSTVLVDAGSASTFLSWGDEEMSFELAGNTYNNFVSVTNYTNLYLDGTSYIFPDTTWSTSTAANSFANIAGAYFLRLAEGKHTFIHRVAVNGGTGNWIVNSFGELTG